MNDNYRRKDYHFPRSMREAYGYDPSEPPELQCLSRYSRYRRPILPIAIAAIGFVIVVWQMVVVYTH